ncbi:PfkB family carbohydrate kinase [Halalkalicoccus tibetensis]|uniref:PfkB family carbohydrate kinase n=1 Tax=Halalkalicoccus tibetensis TaxID=175632 RepID=A0ABD5V2J5_9EURY
MSYDELAEALANDAGERTITAFPDGSVDVYYSAYDAHGEPIEDRGTFAERLVEDPPAFPVTRESTEPGGQAVNMAIQSDALGDRTSLFGHLDDPVLADWGFETTSMGDPSRVEVYPMDEDVLFAERSEELGDWVFDDLRTVADDFEGAFEADAVCCGNWPSAPGLTGAFRELADSAIDGGVLVFDPGPISVRSGGEIRELFDALSALEGIYDVVLSVNGSELRTATAVLGAGGDGREGVVALREELGVTGVVLHTADEALAATAEGVIEVPNRSVDEPARETGAGDRFTAGLAHALAHEWDWELALALGNVCGAYYVENAETADREALIEWL